MITLDLAAALKTEMPRACVAALGFFDGVHLGHRALLAAAGREAAARGLPLLVFSFLDSDAPKPAPRLTSPEERVARLSAAGADYAVFAGFSNLRTLSPIAFVRDILYGTCHALVAFAGYNFRFGQGAAGDAAMLCGLMREAGGEAVIEPPVLSFGVPVSSTAIREALARGDCAAAAAMLGSPYTLTSPVLPGAGLGRRLGFPTANQRPPEGRAQVRPGVYRTRCRTENGGEYDGVTDVGTRPTVGGDEVRIETCLLDFTGNLYGTSLSVSFAAYLRPERRFPDTAALTRQIQEDTERVRAWRAGQSPDR